MSVAERPPPALPEGTAALAPFVAAGVLREAEVQVAGAVARSVPGTDGAVLLAVALCVRALQLGHVCVELAAVADTVVPDDPDAGADEGQDVDLGALPWPEPAAWAEALHASDAVAVRDPATGEPVGSTTPGELRPLAFDGRRAYLERWWRFERAVGDALLGGAGAAATSTLAGADPAVVDEVLDRYLGPEADDGPDLQRRGVAVALRRPVAVLAGGPGTGKTHTVARLLAAAVDLGRRADRPVEVALAAPTGKAAARMAQAIHAAAAGAGWPEEVVAPMLAAEATTLHRLLGSDHRGRMGHGPEDPLPHDLVVVDETSMVDLPLMAHLLAALRPDAHLVLVGDPFQLASVEAGAVLGDIVGPLARAEVPVAGPLAEGIVVLRRVHRFAEGSAIAALADAVRAGRADEALAVLSDPAAAEVAWVDPADAAGLRAVRNEVADAAAEVAAAAIAGDAEGALAAAGELKVLCGTRFGPLGTVAWRDHLEHRLPSLVEGLHPDRRWYVGRPVIVTRNDPLAGVVNGDTGVVVRDGDRTVVALPGPDGVRTLPPSRLDAVETWWSMTIHKSQGSELDHAVVSLPDARSRVLTNELLYTGITRGRRRVTVVATETALRAAIGRPVRRASGLADRLWG